APLPSSGNTGAVFAHAGLRQVGPGLTFGPDGNLYVADFVHSSVARVNGATGEFMDTFVFPGSGGLNGPTGIIFGSCNHLCVSSADNNMVLRYHGTTGTFIDIFINPGSEGLSFPGYLIFTNTDPTTLAYVPQRNRFQITALATAVSGVPFDITV